MQEHILEEPQHGNPIFVRNFPKVYLQDVPGLLQAAKNLSQDSDLRVFHRFDKLRVFYILRLQRHLAKMTKELENLVPLIQNIGPGSDTDPLEKRSNELIYDIESTIRDYDNALWAQERIERLRTPESEFVASFKKKFATANAPISDLDADAQFNLNKLVATPTEAKSWIHRYIDRNPFLARRFIDKSERKAGRENMVIYSEQKIRQLDQVVMNISFCLLLLCPVTVLSLVNNKVAKLSIIVGFLLLSAILMALGTGSNNSTLAVLAAYSAYLVFFLGVGTNPS